MSDLNRISELVSKINNLLEAVRNNNAQFSVLDKDLATRYVREMYELVLAVRTSEITSGNNITPGIPEIKPAEKPVIRSLEDKEESPVVERKSAPVFNEANMEKSPIKPAPEVPVQDPELKKELKITVEETKKSAGENGSKKSISEIYAEKKEISKSTPNEKFKTQGREIADTLKQTPIKDLKAYIGLNKRFTFINSLFNGNEKKYDEAVAKVNSFPNYEEAIRYIQDHLLPSYDWNADDPIVAELFMLVMRRYLN